MLCKSAYDCKMTFMLYSKFELKHSYPLTLFIDLSSKTPIRPLFPSAQPFQMSKTLIRKTDFVRFYYASSVPLTNECT